MPSKKFLVANWKENKGYSQGLVDFGKILDLLRGRSMEESRELIVCPPYPFLPSFKEELARRHSGSSVALGSQDVSRFEEGSFTGEVSVRLLKEFVNYSIVGHHERRSRFFETGQVVAEKIELCWKYKISPVVCVGNKDEFRSLPPPRPGLIVAYEPVQAIGSNHPESPREVAEFYSFAARGWGKDAVFLYGGSVTKDKIRSYLAIPGLSGFLVGGASLDPVELVQMFDIL